jgi:hypothetical protein
MLSPFRKTSGVPYFKDSAGNKNSIARLPSNVFNPRRTCANRRKGFSVPPSTEKKNGHLGTARKLLTEIGVDSKGGTMAIILHDGSAYCSMD